jgi:hypothetical protein
LLKPTVTGHGGGGVAELRRGIEGGVNRWSVHHGVEVGRRLRAVAHAGRRRRLTGSGRKKGVAAPGWASWAAWATQAGWAN